MGLQYDGCIDPNEVVLMSQEDDAAMVPSNDEETPASGPPPAGPYVTLAKIHDPVKAHLLEDVLRQEGVAVTVLGTKDGASIGVGQLILDRRFEVPESQLEWAQKIMSDILGDGQTTGTDEMPPELTHDAPIPEDEPGEFEPKPAAKKQPMRALGLSIYPGFAHWYVGQHWTAVFILVGILSAVINYPAKEMPVSHGLILYGLTVVIGAIVGVRESMREGGPKEWSNLIQCMLGGVIAAAIHALSQWLKTM